LNYAEEEFAFIPEYFWVSSLYAGLEASSYANI